jgi:hypothetical protein
MRGRVRTDVNMHVRTVEILREVHSFKFHNKFCRPRVATPYMECCAYHFHVIKLHTHTHPSILFVIPHSFSPSPSPSLPLFPSFSVSMSDISLSLVVLPDRALCHRPSVTCRLANALARLTPASGPHHHAPGRSRVGSGAHAPRVTVTRQI